MLDSTTQYFQKTATKPASIMVIDNRRTPIMIQLNGNMTVGRQNSTSTTDIILSSSIVGRRHGEFLYDSSTGDYYYVDNNSTNGTYINGNKLPPFNERGTRAYRLSDGDILRIDSSSLNAPHPQAVLMIFSRNIDSSAKWQCFNMANQNNITIGRGRQNLICLQDMMSSREHAVISIGQGGVTITDMRSQNGTIVNGAYVNGARRLFNFDVIRIANTLLILVDGKIFFNNAGERAGALSVHIRKKDVNFGRKTLIKDIRFEADTGDFILILGGSGAGKTTLVNAILGDGKADAEVLWHESV